MLGVAILRQEAFGKVTSDEGIEGSAGAGQADVQGGASPAEGRAKARDGWTKCSQIPSPSPGEFDI